MATNLLFKIYGKYVDQILSIYNILCNTYSKEFFLDLGINNQDINS